jgi:hypothetical protein
MASLNSAAVPPQSTSDWFVDSGASSHMSGINTPLPLVTPTTFPTSITVGNSARLPVTHTASCSIPTRQCNLLLRNILLSPDLVENLISVRKLTCDNLVSVEFDPFGFSIKDLHTRLEMLRCDSDGDLYPLNLQPSWALHAAVNPVDLWHQRLGHPRRQCLLQALRNFNFSCNKSDSHTCQACQLGKHVRLPFTSSESFSFFSFQLIRANVWTSHVLSNSGFQYYLVLLDDYSHYVWTLPMRHKNEVLSILLSFHSYVTTQHRLPILALQTDNGKEFDNFALRSFFSAHDIHLRLSCPYTSP